MLKNIHKDIFFISDYFCDQISGGAELNDAELINYFSTVTNLKKKQSHLVNKEILKKNKHSFFIISNFSNLDWKCREYLYNNLEYIIYEHDHKYLKTRNPADYNKFKAENTQIVNYFLYKNAKKVICQSKFHEKLLKTNLPELDNIINIGGNLWSIETLEHIRSLSKKNKSNKCSILSSNIVHKNTVKSIEYCTRKNLEYELVRDKDYNSFLAKLGANDKFVFFPKTPETLSRLVVEARMMGLKIITNDLVGATHEDWFSLKGEKLIDFMVSKRHNIISLLSDIIEEHWETIKRPIVSVVSTFYHGEEYLEGFLKNITEQTIFADCELILVDTASPGREGEIVERYLQLHKNIKYIRLEKRLTPSQGTTIAIKNSTGKFLNVACLDDRKSKDSLEILLKELESNPAVDLVYGQVYQTSKPNETFEKNSSNNILFDHSILEFSRENMVKCLPGPMPLWRKTLHEKNGFFIDDEASGAAGNDWEMWLRAVENGSIFKRVNRPIGLYMTGGRSQQEDNLSQRQQEAKIFFKYSHIFGYNYHNFKTYFSQFMEK